MKIIGIFILAISILGCGQDSASNPKKTVNLPASDIAWQGYVSEDQKLFAIFDKTIGCLRNSGFETTAGEPYVIVTIPLYFQCGDYFTPACQSGDTIYHRQFDLYNSSVFSHEVVHWATGLNNSDHDNPVFSTCGNIVDAPPLIDQSDTTLPSRLRH